MVVDAFGLQVALSAGVEWRESGSVDKSAARSSVSVLDCRFSAECRLSQVYFSAAGPAAFVLEWRQGMICIPSG